MVKPYFETKNIKIYQGDCLDIMPQIERKVDLIITDPFYGSSGRDGSVHLEKDNILGNRMSSDAFIWFVRQYSKNFYQITKEDSHCYVFSDWRKYKDVQIAFETNFWELRQLIVWNKQNGMGEYWRSSHEFILFFTKRHPRKLTHGGCFNVISGINTVKTKNKHHDYEKPIELINNLILASSNENHIILDAFMGSGTTLIAAEYTGRKAIGIEVSKINCAIAAKRIRAETRQLTII